MSCNLLYWFEDLIFQIISMLNFKYTLCYISFAVSKEMLHKGFAKANKPS